MIAIGVHTREFALEAENSKRLRIATLFILQ